MRTVGRSGWTAGRLRRDGLSVGRVEKLVNYVDNVLAHTPNWQGHITVTRQFLTMVPEANLTLGPTKCSTLKVLRAHGMNDSALQSVYQAVIISKLMYGSSAWWGFASPSDRQRIQAFIRCSERSRFTPPDLPLFADLSRQADENLFNSILNNSHHVQHHLLPPPSQASQHYTLRSRRHNLQLSITSTSLIDKNFLPRMLHMDSY